MDKYEITQALRNLLQNCAVDQDSDLYGMAAQGLSELEEHFDLVDKRYAMAIIWQIDDVLSIRPDLTDGQAGEVLGRVEDIHDASIGVSWDTLESVADDLYPEEDEA